MRVAPQALRYPFERVLLARTKLAYVHLGNLLTDAKRDRAARVFGYVVVWLPEEALILYLQEGEVVAATSTTDASRFTDVPIREALHRVPHAAEYGEICFHEAADEQLACMHAAQTLEPEPWPPAVRAANATAVLGHLAAITYDGMLEVNAGGAISYAALRNGVAERAYLADTGTSEQPREIERALHAIWAASPTPPLVRRWEVPQPLPNQAAPALIDAYRALVRGLVDRLTREGVRSPAQLVDRARQSLATKHPLLERFGGASTTQDPVTTAPQLAGAVGALVTDVLWAASLPDAVSPEAVLRDLTRERRHLFQSAGFFETLSWKVW